MYALLSTISTGNVDAADWLFLIGAILIGLAAVGVSGYVPATWVKLATFFFYTGVGFAVVALLIL